MGADIGVKVFFHFGTRSGSCRTRLVLCTANSVNWANLMPVLENQNIPSNKNDPESCLLLA